MSSLVPVGLSFLFLLCFFPLIFPIALAAVPSSARFRYYANEADLQGGNYVEYDETYIGLRPWVEPFQLCFHNSTPNAFTLALRMGNPTAYTQYFVWEANRGSPVRENATVTFGGDGNLVLADVDGRIVWQTNTANKGVVGFKLLDNGNMVLHDSKGKFIWQSFDYPTDTLLVGQYLRLGGPTKLVSRLSDTENSDGPHSLVLEPKRLAMFYKSPKSTKPYLYYAFDTSYATSFGYLQNVSLGCILLPEGAEIVQDSLLSLDFVMQIFPLSRPKYNSTLSFLRLGIDGNLRLYTYDNTIFKGVWEPTFTLFSEQQAYFASVWESECQLPMRCGKFGVCEDNQCVACPLPTALMGWSKDCEPVDLPPCGSKNFNYYKLEGVNHYISKYTKGRGPMIEEDCEKGCSSDCRCLGYFYYKETSMCWIAYDLHTLTRVANSTHVGYIKAPKMHA